MDQKEIERKVRLIDSYIQAYNSFDIEAMLEFLDEDIEFKNISHGEITDSTNGKLEFSLLAEQSKALFTKRKQEIQNIAFLKNGATVDIVFSATMAISTPDGLKAGQEISFKGSSSFTFKDNKISKIHDIS